MIAGVFVHLLVFSPDNFFQINSGQCRSRTSAHLKLMGQAIESNTLTISKTNVESPLSVLVQIISISKQLYFSSEKKEKTASFGEYSSPDSTRI